MSHNSGKWLIKLLRENRAAFLDCHVEYDASQDSPDLKTILITGLRILDKKTGDTLIFIPRLTMASKEILQKRTQADFSRKLSGFRSA